MLPGILENIGKSIGPPTFNVMKVLVALFRINVKQNIKTVDLGLLWLQLLIHISNIKILHNSTLIYLDPSKVRKKPKLGS